MPKPGIAIADRLIDLRLRLGTGVASLYLAGRLLERLTRGSARIEFHRLMVQPVRDGPSLPPRLRGGLTVRRLEAGDPAIASALSRADDLGPRLDRGDSCLAAFRDGRLVGYLWLCFGVFEEPDSRCRFVLPAGPGAWDYDMFVAPGERGGPVFAALWDAARDLLRERGIAWTASRISGFNDLSLRSHARLGARPVGWLALLKVGGWQGFAGSLSPYLAVSREGGRPIVVKFRTAAN